MRHQVRQNIQRTISHLTWDDHVKKKMSKQQQGRARATTYQPDILRVALLAWLVRGMWSLCWWQGNQMAHGPLLQSRPPNLTHFRLRSERLLLSSNSPNAKWATARQMLAPQYISKLSTESRSSPYCNQYMFTALAPRQTDKISEPKTDNFMSASTSYGIWNRQLVRDDKQL